jgi:hypothetical protein
MKVLLTDSGKSFLKSASLSPRSSQALNDLMKVDSTPMEALGKWTAGTVARTGPRIGSTEQPTVETTPMQDSGQQDDLAALLAEQQLRQQQQRQQEPMQ